MIDLRPVAYVIGRILTVLSLLMLLPALIDWQAGDGNGLAFVRASLITGFVGVSVSLATANTNARALELRQAWLLTASIWFILPFFASLPYIMGAPQLSVLHAWFEAVSGLTTTGATVIYGLDHMPMGMNLWRGMTTWIGGLGIAFIAMIFVPILRIGGMQFFRTEGFDTFGKALPRATDIARQLFGIYIAITVAAVLSYLAIGMPPLAATVHGLTTVATGGFSPYDASFTGFQGLGEYVAVIFMLLGSLPFIRYVQMINGQPRALWRDAQVRAYLRWLMTAVLTVTIWRVLSTGEGLEHSFRASLFNLTSIMSSTGFFSGTFASWDGLMLVIAFVLGIVGACSGSTAAGISVFRVQIALSVLRVQIRRIAWPSAADPVKYAGRTVEDDIIQAVIMFITGYLLILGVLSVALTLFGVDLESALFAVWATLGNVGYGFGPLVARTGTFIDFPDLAILTMGFSMILGRLGLLAVLVLFLPAFWRR